MGLTIVSLASFSLTNMFNDWATLGVFSYALPFLLIFAVVFAILEKSGILGDNKGVVVIISLAAGLLSLVGGKVPEFFQQIFPNLGIALSVLLVVIIMLGLFAGWKEYGIDTTVKWVMVGSAMVAIAFLVYSSFEGAGFYNDIWALYGDAIITILIIVAIICVVVFGQKKKGP